MAGSASVREREIMDAVGARYRAEGFQFLRSPPREFVPPFLRDYRPDAIALKGKGGVIIELKRSQDGAKDRQTLELSQALAGHPDWRLDLILMENFVREQGWLLGPERIKAPSDEQVEAVRSEVERLVAQGQHSAALLLGWALLEALTRKRLSDLIAEREEPLTEWQVVEQLTTFGLLEPEDEEGLRSLLRRRNALAHGDFAASPSSGEVEALLGILHRLSGSPQV
jgi:hypothetical protein